MCMDARIYALPEGMYSRMQARIDTRVRTSTRIERGSCLVKLSFWVNVAELVCYNILCTPSCQINVTVIEA